MASFVENSLIPGEVIESKAEITWLSQFWYLFFALLGVFALLIPTIFFGLFAVINVMTTELAVTNKKVIGKTGFIQRVSIDLPLDKLESINIDQGVMGRILGFGRVSIRGVGGNNVSIPFIKNPLDFRRVVMGLIDKRSTTAV